MVSSWAPSILQNAQSYYELGAQYRNTMPQTQSNCSFDSISYTKIGEGKGETSHRQLLYSTSPLVVSGPRGLVVQVPRMLGQDPVQRPLLNNQSPGLQ